MQTQHYAQETLPFIDTGTYWGNYLLTFPREWCAFPFYHDVDRSHLALCREPQYHHYHCMDVECDYCRLIEYGIAQKGYALTDFMTFEQFNDMHPIEYYEVDSGGTAWEHKDFSVIWDNLLASKYSSFCHNRDKEEEEEEEYWATYGAGKIIDPSEFEFTEEGWLAPDGTFYYVPDEVGHEDVAKMLLRSWGESSYDCYCDILEGRGWIHITDYYGPERFQYIPPHPTKAQIEVANLFCEAHDISVPEELAYEKEEIKEKQEIKPFTFWQRIEESCKPRSFRDRFYPLSGD